MPGRCTFFRFTKLRLITINDLPRPKARKKLTGNNVAIYLYLKWSKWTQLEPKQTNRLQREQFICLIECIAKFRSFYKFEGKSSTKAKILILSPGKQRTSLANDLFNIALTLPFSWSVWVGLLESYNIGLLQVSIRAFQSHMTNALRKTSWKCRVMLEVKAVENCWSGQLCHLISAIFYCAVFINYRPFFSYQWICTCMNHLTSVIFSWQLKLWPITNSKLFIKSQLVLRPRPLVSCHVVKACKPTS